MTLENKVINIINDNIESNDIKVDINTSLKEDLGLDSLSLIIILNALEDEFDISLDEEQIYSAHTVGEVINKLKETRDSK